MMQFRFLRFVVPLLLTALLGCGNSYGPKRYEVYGTVTYEGQPTPAGQVTLEPDTSQNNEGPGSFGTITNGEYRTFRDRGAVGGPHRVRIVGYNAPPGTVPDDDLRMLFSHEMTVDLPREAARQDFEITTQSSGGAP